MADYIDRKELLKLTENITFTLSDNATSLKALSDIHLQGEWFELDCTYSKGVFYKNIKQPKMKSDLIPLYDDVIQADCRELTFVENETLDSIVFDPPFLFRKRKSKNNDIISKRFSYFSSYEELIMMYEESIICFYKKLRKKGYVFMKCQDMTDGKFYCTHFDIIRLARINGFELIDIAIKYTNKKMQREAKQQNCFAKTHCYWLAFKKVR